MIFISSSQMHSRQIANFVGNRRCHNGRNKLWQTNFVKDILYSTLHIKLLTTHNKKEAHPNKSMRLLLLFHIKLSTGQYLRPHVLRTGQYLRPRVRLRTGQYLRPRVRLFFRFFTDSLLPVNYNKQHAYNKHRHPQI